MTATDGQRTALPLAGGPDHPQPAATSAATSVASGPGPARRRSTPAEDLTYLFFGLWTLVGLCLDGWAHRHVPELETFFTPWHAVFYTGFTGAAATLAWIVARGRAGARSLADAVPEGYQLAVAGLGLFALGGVGDAIWHTVFGVERTIDALLSPTHLVLLVGMLAGITAPFRAAWRDPHSPARPSWRRFLPALLSLTVATTAVAFFFLYANGLNNWPMARPLDPGNTSQAFAALGVLSTIVTPLILLTPVLIALQRWVPPAGSFTLAMTVVGVFMSGLDAFVRWWEIIPAVGAGLATDAVIGAALRRGGGDAHEVTGARRRAALGCGVVVPLATGFGTVALTGLAGDVAWPPELWLGATVMATLAGVALALATHPAPRPAGTVVG